MKNIVAIVVLLILAAFLWGAFNHDVMVTINGEAYQGPMAGLLGFWGVVIAVVGMFCAAIVLILVFSGLMMVGLIIAVLGVVFLGVLSPALLPILLPLLLVLLLAALLGRDKNSDSK